MHNTIEVSALNIKKAEIRYFKKQGLDCDSIENVKHVKILPYLSIVQSIEGSYDISLGNAPTQETGDGGFFIAPSQVQQTIVHHVNKKSGRMICRWIFLDVEINGTYKLDSLYRFPVTVSGDAQQELGRLFDRLFSTDDLFENYSCCYKILGTLLRLATPVRQSGLQAIQAAVDHIKANFAHPIDVATLARLTNMSESNFYAAFKKQFGTSPISYLNRYRLSLAAEQLKETDRTVIEICSDIGIADSFYFSRLFKKTYGLSPRAYRSIHQGGRA